MSTRILRWMAPVALGGGLCLGSPAARAEEVASGIMAQAPATQGSTEVADAGFQKATVEAPEEPDHATELKLSSGGMFSSGNSRLIALTGAGHFRARRSDNQLTMGLAANYSEAPPAPEADMQTTVKNFQGKARYDRFLGEGFAAFLSASARNDRFQGLDLRLNVDPGLAYYFVDQAKQQLWLELGYDLQYDFRHAYTLRRAAEEDGSALLERTDVRHSARGFVGYANNINEAITFNTGLEYLQSVTEKKYWRLNWDAGLNSAIGSNLSIATTFSLRYDNAPLPTIEKTDTVTSVSLVYQLL